MIQYTGTWLSPVVYALVINASGSLDTVQDLVLPSLQIAAVLLSGGILAYFVRQLYSRRKLRRALKGEIRSMEGIKNCRASLESGSDGKIKASEVPPPGTIPTEVYETNVAKLGLLKEDTIEDVVDFYSDVLRYKSIISAVRSEKAVPEADQDELRDNIGDLEARRLSLFGDNWIDEGD